jgi:hypothetical protein
MSNGRYHTNIVIHDRRLRGACDELLAKRKLAKFLEKAALYYLNSQEGRECLEDLTGKVLKAGPPVAVKSEQPRPAPLSEATPLMAEEKKPSALAGIGNMLAKVGKE